MPARTPSSPLTRWCSRSEKAGAWSTCTPLIATGINADGYREILGGREHRRGRRGLVDVLAVTDRPGLRVKLVTSDAHAGLVAAIGGNAARAAWQRCRTHYTTNLMAITPKASWPWVRTLLHSVFDQPDAESVDAQYDRVIEALADKLPKVADHLEAACADLLAFTAFPKAIWAPDLVEQSPGAAQQRDPPPHRRCRHLPRPQLPDPPSSAQSWPNNTTNGPSPAATSAWRSSANPEPTTAHRQNRRPPQRH